MITRYTNDKNDIHTVLSVLLLNKAEMPLTYQNFSKDTSLFH